MERLDDVATVETPEQLELALPLAGVGSRALAFIFDFLIQLIPIVIAMIVLVVSFSLQLFKAEDAKGLGEGRLPLMASALFSAIVFATNFLYFTFWDLVSRGQSPGKRALKLRVVRDGGLPIDARSSLIRNLVRTVDMLPGFYLTGLLSIFLSREHKRIGDLAAGTLVIRDHAEAVGDASAIFQLPSARAASASASAPASSAADRALIEDFLDRRSNLAEGAAARLARNIADQLAPRYGADPSLSVDRVLYAARGSDLSAIFQPAPSVGASPPSPPSSPPLNPVDRALVHDFLDRRSNLSAEAKARLSRQIANQMAPRYGIDPSLSADSILDQLAKR
jgi:uncharacterized RDD family membrane protein YckC